MLDLSENALRLIGNTNVVQQLVVEIDGMPMFSSIDVERYWFIGDDVKIGDVGLKIGGTISYPNQKVYITMSGNTTRNIKQTLNQDKFTGTTVTTINIELVDKNLEITELFSSGYTGTEVLGKYAKVYLSFVGGSHPEDSIILLSGMLDTVNFLHSTVQLAISHPMQLARQDVFVQKNTELAGSIDDAVTTIPTNDASFFILPADDMSTYLRIDDEIIKYTGISTNSFTGCTRGSLSTSNIAHDDDAEVSAIYRFEGNAFDIVLKVLMSGQSASASEDVKDIGATYLKPFNTNYIIEYGVVAGDFFDITGSAIGGNNITVTISSWETIDGELFIYVEEALTAENDSAASIVSRSQYDLFNDGAALDGRHVDVARMEDLRDGFNFAIPNIDLSIDSAISAKDFIETKIFRPCGIYSVPRKGKISCSITLPPFSGQETIELNSTNIVDGKNIRVNRTINKNYYNYVNFRYKQSYLTGKFLRGEIVVDSESVSDFGVGARVSNIDAECFRDGSVTFLQSQGTRIIERYKRGAETLKIKTNYKTGIAIEIGDILVFDGSGVGVSDSKTGGKSFKPRLMEAINKEHPLSDGNIPIELMDIAYDATGRYAAISPSSEIDTGSTDTILKLQLSNSAKGTRLEGSKWEDFIGESVKVHSADYSVVGTSMIDSVSASDESKIILSSALAFTPSSGYVIDLDDYENISDANKIRYAFRCRVDAVVSAASSTSVTVGDGSLYYIGMNIRVHNATFGSDSGVKKVTNIAGNVLTVDDLGFTPNNTFSIQIGFVSDEAQFYLYL